MKVILKEAGEKPLIMNIPNDLSTLQKLVGGYIETRGIEHDIVLICNEDGKILGLPRNIKLTDNNGVVIDEICGTVIATGVDGDEFDSLSDEQTEFVANWLSNCSVYY